MLNSKSKETRRISAPQTASPPHRYTAAVLWPLVGGLAGSLYPESLLPVHSDGRINFDRGGLMGVLRI
jgi:hypothetical protein